jgi:hypothetical protein
MPSSNKPPPKFPPRKIASRDDLKELQRFMAQAVFRPLTEDNQMQRTASDGRPMDEVADSFIKPNDRLTSFDRLEIYNRQYWFRVLDCFYDDYPGLRAILGERKFGRLARAYLVRHPSTSFSLRNLGRHLESFLREEPVWVEPNAELALEMVRFEWAQIVAFDGESLPALTPAELQTVQPSRLRLALQPFLTLLEVHYPVDDFSIALKKQNALRNEASNAFESAPEAKPLLAAKIRLPHRSPKPLYLAVHRFENALYYKSLEPEAYAILVALRDGATLTQACDLALRDVVQDGSDWPARIRGWFANWSAMGWLCSRAANPRRLKEKKS